VIPLQPVRPSALKIHSSLFIVAAIYAVSYTMAKEVMPSHIQPRGFILLRITGALVCLFIYHAVFIREKIKSPRDYFQLAICAFFGVALNMVMFFEGLSRTSPIHAPLIMVTTPILVLIIGFLLKEEKLSAAKIFGVVLGTIGAGMLITGRAGGDREATFWGDVMIMINAASFAIYLVLVKPIMSKYHPITVSLWTFVFGFIFVFPFGIQQLTRKYGEQSELVRFRNGSLAYNTVYGFLYYFSGLCLECLGYAICKSISCGQLCIFAAGFGYRACSKYRQIQLTLVTHILCDTYF